MRKISSVSAVGSSRITLEIDPKLDMEFVDLAIKEAISQGKGLLPNDVKPSITAYVPEDIKTREFMSMTISSNRSLQELRYLLKDKLELGLGGVKGVAKATFMGGSDPEIRVVLDDQKMKALGLNPYAVEMRLNEYLEAHPTGRINKSGKEYILKIEKSMSSLDDLGRMVVAHTNGVTRVPIRLADIGRINPTYGEIEYINRINGRPTVMLTLQKEKGANSLRVSRDVRKTLAKIRGTLPRDLIFETVSDESLELMKNLSHIELLAVIITVLVFLIVFMTLKRFIPSLLILSSVAFSVVITFNLIYLLHIHLNMLTLGALTLGFGMFVDNSIVVFENTLRLREEGLSAREAAVRGAKEVFLPVLASTLTTVGVFFLFSVLPGKAPDILPSVGFRHVVRPDRLAPRLFFSHPGSKSRTFENEKKEGRFRKDGEGSSAVFSREFSGIHWRPA